MATSIFSPTTFNDFLSLNHSFTTSKNNVYQRFAAPHLSLSTPRTSKRLQSNFRVTRKLIVRCNNVEPGLPLPPGPPNPNNSNLNGWIVGILASVILPLLYRKWGSLMQLKNGVEKALHTAEEIVDGAEKVAEAVEKVAEDIADNIPAGKFKDAVQSIEKVAEKVDKDAETLGDFIHKVEEVEAKVEDEMELLEELGEKKRDKSAKVEKD